MELVPFGNSQSPFLHVLGLSLGDFFSPVVSLNRPGFPQGRRSSQSPPWFSPRVQGAASLSRAPSRVFKASYGPTRRRPRSSFFISLVAGIWHLFFRISPPIHLRGKIFFFSGAGVGVRTYKMGFPPGPFAYTYIPHGFDPLLFGTPSPPLFTRHLPSKKGLFSGPAVPSLYRPLQAYT